MLHESSLAALQAINTNCMLPGNWNAVLIFESHQMIKRVVKKTGVHSDIFVFFFYLHHVLLK